MISAGDEVLNDAGVDIVAVDDGPTNAGDGKILAGFTADVEFDVSDTSFRSSVKGRKLTFIENRAFTSPLDRVVDVFQMCFRYVSDMF